MTVWEDMCGVQEFAMPQDTHCAAFTIREKYSFPKCLLVEPALHERRNVTTASICAGVLSGAVHVRERGVFDNYRERQSIRIIAHHKHRPDRLVPTRHDSEKVGK